MRDRNNEKLQTLPEAIVPLGAFNSPSLVLRKIPVNVKPNPEKVGKPTSARAYGPLDPFQDDIFNARLEGAQSDATIRRGF